MLCGGWDLSYISFQNFDILVKLEEVCFFPFIEDLIMAVPREMYWGHGHYLQRKGFSRSRTLNHSFIGRGILKGLFAETIQELICTLWRYLDPEFFCFFFIFYCRLSTSKVLDHFFVFIFSGLKVSTSCLPSCCVKNNSSIENKQLVNKAKTVWFILL